MKPYRLHLCSVALCLCFNVQNASAGNDPAVPLPYIVAPECTPEQLSSAKAVARESKPVVACFYLAKWSFKGAALATAPQEYTGKVVTPVEFNKMKREVFAAQSARLRTQRDLKETIDGEPPAHASMPLSLFVRTRTPLGNESGVGRDQLPLIRLETWVLTKGHVFRLVQMSPISGPSTIGEGFRMADDWARRFNGSERLASED